jgi:hypothetical protein
MLVIGCEVFAASVAGLAHSGMIATSGFKVSNASIFRCTAMFAFHATIRSGGDTIYMIAGPARLRQSK